MTQGTQKRWYKRWWGIFLILFLGACVVFTLGFAVLVGVYFFQIQDDAKFLENISQFDSADRALVETADDPFLGNPDASLVIVEFSDFQCPFCREEFFVLQQLIQKYADRIKLIYRDFPVSEVNPLAMDASLAANCAHEQNKFWEYHAQLFLNQQDLDQEALVLYAKQVGLEVGPFERCLTSRKFESEIHQDLVDGLEAGVASTPTFFINGLKAEGAIPLEMWERLLNNYFAL